MIEQRQLVAVMPALERPSLWHGALCAALQQFEINTPARIAAFLAQVAYESDQCRGISERLNYSAVGLTRTWPKRFPSLEAARPYEYHPERLANHVYANRLGNGPPESRDGFRFRGRGLIQMTGRSNYASVSQALGIDFVSNPDALLDPRNAAMSAAWFWKSRGLSELADDRTEDDDNEDFRQITRIINGGLNGLADRVEFWVRAKQALRTEPARSESRFGESRAPAGLTPG
jgi:putative chitinase